MAVFRWRHFAGEIILWAVRWYCRYGISYRELEEMMGERGVAVDHTTVYRWTQRYAPELEKRLCRLGVAPVGEPLSRQGSLHATCGVTCLRPRHHQPRSDQRGAAGSRAAGDGVA